MEDYYGRNYVPAFGSWDWNEDLAFTQCFKSSRRQSTGGVVQLDYNYSDHRHDRDLYVAGDLYHNQLLTPAMIVLPRSKVKKAASPLAECSSNSRLAAKPVDNDLYKISPHFL